MQNRNEKLEDIERISALAFTGGMILTPVLWDKYHPHWG